MVRSIGPNLENENGIAGMRRSLLTGSYAMHLTRVLTVSLPLTANL
jgi:hypothetical protein